MNKLMMVFMGVNLLLVACSTNAPVTKSSPGTVKKAKVLRVQQETLTAIRKVAVVENKSNTGRTAGSITGSILGAYGSYPGSILGSMIGGAVDSGADIPSYCL
jgi:outer membrane lipoprotein SlyB